MTSSRVFALVLMMSVCGLNALALSLVTLSVVAVMV